MENQYLYFSVIALFAVVQSMFGMGMLILGTPTLLLLGFDFSTVLGLLLPSSILISLTQVITGDNKNMIKTDKKNMLICAISILLFLSFILKANIKINIDLLIGFILLFSAAIHLSDRFRETIKSILVKNERIFVTIMGGIHGVTNMGGALLAVYATATNNEKTDIRNTVSRYYLMFGLIQLITLATIKPEALSINGFSAAPLALFIYLSVGNNIFRKTSAPTYERLITLFITVYGAAVLTKGYF